ncbi:brevican core protein-like [Pundamilia nyererei]|uniref:Brevican core protein-like n=1 Tax=Pundamilia nyererei TaxID=303518 RepID=A0A9Y6MA03_9CICH|nr:PREDICTED: brevican core protein-like [Pundamilia nyererei]
MLLRVIRHVQILPLLYAVCHLTLAFPTQTLRYTYDEVEQLHVSIPHSGPVVAPLSSSISIPCVVSLSPISNSTSATPVVPRVKWSVISRGVETQILVVRGHKVKVNEAYRDRAALLNYTSFPDDASLWLGDLRSSDSAHYRCEVQQGLEDASDLVELKVKGVVFHYRDALGRYAFTFHQAQRACEAIGARIATADQLLASYYDGYEQCDAGWLADQSVRYPIQVPREACYGDMDGQPGVRNYGTMDPDDLFDVYCYVDEINGEVFHDFIPQQLTFNEAQSYCRAAGAELATTAQLYLAWSEGLDHCSPGWLSDGSVRYPIITPRERCGGALPGVKTLYQFSNQTGFPEPSSLHDVYCFKENRNASTDSPMDYVGTEPEDIEHNVVILTEKYQEIQLNQLAEQVEREAQSMLESLPYFTVSVTTESPVDTHPMLISDTTESPLHTTPTLHEPLDQTLSPTEMSYDSQHPTALMSSTITETHNSAENTSFLPTDYNETYSSQNSSLTFQQSERPTFEPEMQNQTEPDTNIEVNTEPSGTLNETKEVQQTTLSFNKSEPNYSETDSNRSKEDSLLEATTLTLNPMVEVELEETRVDPEQMFPPTEASKEEEEEATLLTQLSQTTESTPEVLTSVWAPLDGSGDISEESKLDMSPASFISTSDSSTSGFTTHPSPIASASSTHAEPQTVVPHLTASSQSPLSDKLGLDILSTASQLWESPNSKQEGSASLEIEDTLSLENEDKMLPTAKSEDLQVSGASSVTTRSPDISNTSHSSTSSPTALYLTSGYRMYLDTVTDTYEEASGHVPDTLRTTLQEDIKFAPTFEGEVSLTLEEEANISVSLEKEIKISPTLALQKEANVSLNFEEENIVSPTVDFEENVSSAHESNAVPTAVFKDEEANITSQTSKWDLLTSTTQPQESRNEYSQKTSTAASSSSRGTKPTKTTTVATTTTTAATTTTTTTHRSRHTWSPTTTTPKMLIPPVGHALEDVDITFTQPPTLLIMPNERAAVGGTGKSSDACLLNPCLNGGTCTDRGGHIKCLCLPTYEGNFCQADRERCEPGWDKFHGFCYRHFSQRLSWEAAEQHCRMMGAHLVSIITPEEQAYINNNYKEYQWTGLNDKTIENDFHWSDGNPLLYENWYRGQPDSYFLSGEDCVVMVWHDNGRWSDVPCNYHLSYTCKKGTSSCGPPPRVRNASIYGKARQTYETNAVVRYRCAEGFQQRFNPLIRCLSGGFWERPQILCLTEDGGLPSMTNNDFAAAEDDFEATKATLQYWDIRF